MSRLIAFSEKEFTGQAIAGPRAASGHQRAASADGAVGAGRRERGTEVRSDVRREFDDVIGYDVSKEELVCIAATLK